MVSGIYRTFAPIYATGKLADFFISDNQSSFYFMSGGGWKVLLTCPSLENVTWSRVKHAMMLDGSQSFWKILWRWVKTIRTRLSPAPALEKSNSGTRTNRLRASSNSGSWQNQDGASDIGGIRARKSFCRGYVFKRNSTDKV